MSELSSLLRSLMQQQADCDIKAEQERARQEERWVQIQQQFTRLQHEVQHDRQDHQRLMGEAAAASSSFVKRGGDPERAAGPPQGLVCEVDDTQRKNKVTDW